MALKDWFHPGAKKEMQAELNIRVGILEEQIKLLMDSKRTDCEPRMVIQHVEKIVIERWDHSNHFDTIDIKELSGRLNIGANYTGYIPDNGGPPIPKKDELSTQKDRSSGEGNPRVHLRPKKEL